MDAPAIQGFAPVDLPSASVDRFESVLEPEVHRAFLQRVAFAGRLLAGRTVWNVNSTATGGGVAEMLRALLPYVIGSGIDARWLVLGGDPEFFRVTKRVHNRLHGSAGDGGELGAAELATLRRVSAEPARALAAAIRPGDVVVLHDPQTAGLTAALAATGTHVIWRCHVGVDRPDDTVRSAWDFLRPLVRPASAFVFSKRSFAWEGLPADEIAVIPPSIDPFSPKNERLQPAQRDAILAAAGFFAGRHGDAELRRADGSLAPVLRPVQHVAGEPLPEDAPLVVQVSRWDALKDPIGVLRGFTEHVAPRSEAHLALVGPGGNVTDDPEGAAVLAACRQARSELPAPVRARLHLVGVPTDDTDENAMVVNAVQRRADVLVQKSLAEGFGLTVTEGMWKARPVVASRVGGIEDQIEDGQSGLLVDPRDLGAFGGAVLRLLGDPDLARRLGEAAFEAVRSKYLPPAHLTRYLALIARLAGVAMPP